MNKIGFFILFASCVLIAAGCSSDDEAASFYSVKITAASNGTASADVETAQSGAPVTITATANDGYEFEKWTVVSGDVILSNSTDSPATFTMLEEEVEILASFIFNQTRYSVTVTTGGNGIASANVETAKQGDPITITATANGGYQFGMWIP